MAATPKGNKTELDHMIKVVDKLDTAIDKLTDVSTDIKHMNTAQRELMEKIGEINKWRWQVMGGAMAIAALISVITQLIAHT